MRSLYIFPSKNAYKAAAYEWVTLIENKKLIKISDIGSRSRDDPNRSYLVHNCRNVWRHCMPRKDVFVWHYFYFSQWKLTTHYHHCQMKKNIKVGNKKKALFSSWDIESLGKHAVNKCYSWLRVFFNELTLRPGRVLIVCCLLFEPRATVQQLASWLTDDTIPVKKLTVAFVFDGTRQHTWRARDHI